MNRRRPKLLDLYCGEGGASQGYHQAGFEIVGVDKNPQPRYPFPFVQADAIAYLNEHWQEFDAVAGSPPCQGYSDCWQIQKRDHPLLIGPTREAMIATGLPYVIENVPGSAEALINPVELCGTMFGLRTYRHRLFEANWTIATLPHLTHFARQAKMGRPVRDGEFMQIVGNFSNVTLARQIMEMPWASRNGLSEAVPVAYTRFIGTQLIHHLTTATIGASV